MLVFDARWPCVPGSEGREHCACVALRAYRACLHCPSRRRPSVSCHSLVYYVAVPLDFSITNESASSRSESRTYACRKPWIQHLFPRGKVPSLIFAHGWAEALIVSAHIWIHGWRSNFNFGNGKRIYHQLTRKIPLKEKRLPAIGSETAWLPVSWSRPATGRAPQTPWIEVLALLKNTRF